MTTLITIQEALELFAFPMKLEDEESCGSIQDFYNLYNNQNVMDNPSEKAEYAYVFESIELLESFLISVKGEINRNDLIGDYANIYLYTIKKAGEVVGYTAVV